MIKKFIQLFRSVPNPSTPPTSPQLLEPICDSSGIPYSKAVGTASGTSPDFALIEAAVGGSDTVSIDGTKYSLSTFSVTTLYDPESAYNRREKSNHNSVILASAARTATTNGAQFENFSERGVYFITNITAGAGYSIQPELQIYDSISAGYVTLATGAALTASGTYVFKIYPGITEIAGFAYNMMLPRYWRFRMVHGNANSVTYSVSGQVIK